MSKISPSLRKAAVLISALDEATAESLLGQMGRDEAAKVRSTLVELDEISADEQQQVLAEFLQQQGASAPAATVPEDDVTLDLGPAVEALAADIASQPRSSAPAPPLPSACEPPLAFLQHVQAEALASALGREQPQTIAVVVAELPPQHAAAVLQQLPSSLATDALERMASLADVSTDVAADLARELRQQLAPHLHTAGASPASLGHLTAVLGAMDYRQRQRVVLQLAERNTALLRRLGLFAAASPLSPAAKDRVVAFRYRLESQPQAATPSAQRLAARRTNRAPVDVLAFEELELLDDAALRSVFAAADPQVVLLALTGAEQRLLARILRQLPAPDAAVLRRRLEHPGPVRLRDIEQAREELTAVAGHLAHEGSIALPRGVGFAAAV